MEDKRCLTCQHWALPPRATSDDSRDMQNRQKMKQAGFARCMAATISVWDAQAKKQYTLHTKSIYKSADNDCQKWALDAQAEKKVQWHDKTFKTQAPAADPR